MPHYEQQRLEMELHERIKRQAVLDGKCQFKDKDQWFDDYLTNNKDLINSSSELLDIVAGFSKNKA